jgi:O-succinylbenzoic acid--CoA ligase
MTCRYFGLNKKTNALLCLSTDYIAGKMMVVRAYVCGMNLMVVPPSGNPLKGIHSPSGIDFAAMAPLQVIKCLNSYPTKIKFQSIKQVIIGGAEIPYLFEIALSLCPNQIYSTFGMTETLSHIAIRKLIFKNLEDAYLVLPGIGINTDSRGCLMINAPYLKGTIQTNDMVEIIDEQHFKWLGRYDNVVNSGGIKIYPELLEKKLSSVITKHRFFISSFPDEALGQKIVLAIEGATKSRIQSIKVECEKALTKYEVPKEYISVPQFKETETGKVIRKL